MNIFRLLRLVFGRLIGGSEPSQDGETCVTRELLYVRRSCPDWAQWWHPSFFWSLILNLVGECLKLYGRWYYWPAWLARGKYVADEARENAYQLHRYRLSILFRELRRVVMILALILVGIQYSYGSSCHSICFLLVLGAIFLALLLDNLFGQWADLAVFIQGSSRTLLAVLLAKEHLREHLFQGRRSYRALAKADREALLSEQVEEIRQARVVRELRAVAFRFCLLPIRHILGLIVIWSLVAMSLHLYSDGLAFKNLGFEAPKDRSILGFAGNLVDSLYYSATTVATIGYGDVAPNGIEDEIKPHESRQMTPCASQRQRLVWATRACSLGFILLTIMTVMVSFNLGLNAVTGLASALEDKEKLERAIREFWEEPNPYPIVS